MSPEGRYLLKNAVALRVQRKTKRSEQKEKILMSHGAKRMSEHVFSLQILSPLGSRTQGVHRVSSGSFPRLNVALARGWNAAEFL
jgi:hypothetical protein